jgi:hypothetical protein
MSEPNTTVDNNEPTLDQFNEPAPATAADAKPAAANAAEPAKTSDAQPAGQQPAGQAAQQTQPAAQTQPADDPYVHLVDNVQVPQGVELDKQAVNGLIAIAKKHNISVEAAKEIMQLDLNSYAAQAMAEEKLIADAQAKWAQENQAKYGDNLKNVETNCSRVLAELDKEGKFKELLATAGVSGHPATLGFLKTIGDLYLEKSSVNPNATVSTDDEEVELENFN